jgi:hypothetical protein
VEKEKGDIIPLSFFYYSSYFVQTQPSSHLGQGYSFPMAVTQPSPPQFPHLCSLQPQQPESNVIIEKKKIVLLNLFILKVFICFEGIFLQKSIIIKLLRWL